ncbi:MAG TPA: hypothetical protein VNY51_03320, partial [Candidatus Dormibacteraeota bacterium]|nr:hypothetical protein [Candidatus Dormibacteraeota bacterium]
MSYLDGSYLNEQRERRRLADNYASMTDGELRKLAQNADSLTDVAWDTLEDELDRRHLELPDDEHSEDEYAGIAQEKRQQLE